MNYNTDKSTLILPEYGRNVQDLVEQAVEIKDDEERAKFVQKIIELMGRMYPYLRDLRDFKHKLWDHLVIMSSFKLEADSPYPSPQAVTYSEPPAKIQYSNKRFKYRHYGKSVVKLLKHASELPEGEEKTTLIGLAANHMRKLYLTWSKTTVEDSEIFNHINELSEGKITIPEGMVLSNIKVQNNSVQSAKYQSKKKKSYKKKR